MKQKIQGINMQILLHVAAWASLFGLPLFFFMRLDIPKQFVWAFYINAFAFALIFYGNYLVLIPRLFFSNRKIQYYLAAFMLLAGLFLFSLLFSNLIFNRKSPVEAGHRLRPLTEEVQKHEEHRELTPDRGKGLIKLPFGPMHVYNFIFNAVVFTVFAMGLRVLQRHAQIEKRQKELEKEKLNSELAFLKNQISPHFFFNTLNNIYSLISINTEDSQDAVLKLSRMMRYLLYESEQGETHLSNEIDFMNNYIDLMKLRISEKVKLNVSFPEKYDNIAIPPLLFIAIIENAFKHGISYRDKSFIDISMEVSSEMLTFRCTNSIVTPIEKREDNNTGIGLENLRKRLNLLFPDKHDFITKTTDSEYLVRITINLT
jgi:two-component system, LytTR family, sensor kinase